MTTDRIFNAPTVVNLEVTELCNAKCVHCYNPWREESMGVNSFDDHKINLVLDKLIESKVFHVVFTGGEPFSNFKILSKALKKCKDNNISVSCNSNLMLTTTEKVKELRDAGLDHILTSLPSIDPLENDLIMQTPDSLAKITRGIKHCIENDIRVSVNMVITKNNINKVYDTGKFIAELGCHKFFVTRAVPPTYTDVESKEKLHNSIYDMSKEEVFRALDDAIRIRDEFNIRIGSLVSYPLCFLNDLEKYKDFVGRGCPSQRGDRMNINANGNIHACVHEEESYGNLFEDQFEKIYTESNYKKWHDGSMKYNGCDGCEYIKMCNSGCQMVAQAYNGKIGSRDPLYVGPNSVSKHFSINNKIKKKLEDKIKNKSKFYVPERVRFRDEGNFYLINARWANTISINKKLGQILEEYKNKKIHFNIDDIGEENIQWLTYLYFKDMISSDQIDIEKDDMYLGLSFSIEHLPEFIDTKLN